MPKYILLLRETPNSLGGLSAEEMQAIIQKYKAWGDELGRAGRLVGGEKLVDSSGRVLERCSGRVAITDGPYVETKEVIAGYFMVEAESYERAVELARTCPHLDFGKIEVREVDPV